MIKPNLVEFKLADLDRHMPWCIEFRRDSFLINYAEDRDIDTELGTEGELYAKRLREFQHEYPYGVIHVWRQQELIGQIEFHIESPFVDKAFIPLFYLIPEERGQGAGSLMHDYLVETLREMGCNGARIPVSSMNERAVRFYKKHGWRYAKPDTGASNVDLYQLNF